MKSISTIVLTLLFVSTFFPPNTAASTKQPLVNWGEEYIKARGLGSFKGSPSARKLIIAREKAKMRAEAAVLGIVEGMNIDSNTTIKETMNDEEYSEIITRQIKGRLKGAQILQEGQLNNNTYEVIVGVRFSEIRKATVAPKDPDKPASEKNPIVIPSMNFQNMGTPPKTEYKYMKAKNEEQSENVYGKVTTVVTNETPKAVKPPQPSESVDEEDLDVKLYGGYSSSSQSEQAKEPVNEEPATNETVASLPDEQPSVSVIPGEAVTGLIVNGLRLKADRAFWPRLLGPRQEVLYGNYDASLDFLQDEGAVAYCKTLAEAKECKRAGNNPLIVNAIDVYGQYQADLVVSAETAAQIRKLEKSYGFMKAYKVIFVLK